MSDVPRPPTRRQPLGEATRRVNNIHDKQHSSLGHKHDNIPHHESLQVDGLLQVRNGTTSPHSPDCHAVNEYLREGSPGASVANPRLSAISKEYPNSNRNSQISTVSTNASDGKRVKAKIGPWRLGKTLGKGATARVRFARHAYTGKEAAIKIVQKKHATMTQAGSLANLDKVEAGQTDFGDGLRRMPLGIEREVAIMKLVQHPHVMKLYDIWENRTEM
jgi:serine/threonine-protein kinase HSL1, negative regulator of Swe1 kinase